MKTNKILIVDDASFMRTMLKDILESGGYEVVGEASNGAEAVEKFNKLQPDIVTMDITMPNGDGISTLEQIMKKNPNAKIVMCSAMGQQSMVIKSMLAGAKDFILKPFQADKILETLNKIKL